jgi:hypothetical protein
MEVRDLASALLDFSPAEKKSETTNIFYGVNPITPFHDKDII